MQFKKPPIIITVTLLALILTAAGPLLADFVEIGGDGELSFNRPFCGT